MGAGLYEVVVVNAKTQRQTTRDWSAAELLKGVAWLKRMNAQGGDIYLRSLDGPELLLVDALNAAAVEDMRRQGLAPAMTVETSPGRFQAWVKLSDHPLPEELRKHALSGLARVLPKVGKHGRLAGFTNQQIEANEAGRQSFVLVREATGNVAPAARPYLKAMDRTIREHAAERQRLAQLERDMLIQAERQRLEQVERDRTIQVNKKTLAPRHDRGHSR